MQVGELYLGQALALLTDEHIIPEHLLTPSIAFFMFLITIIGGNVPLLVPFALSIVGFSSDVDITFRAAEAYSDGAFPCYALINLITEIRLVALKSLKIARCIDCFMYLQCIYCCC